MIPNEIQDSLDTPTPSVRPNRVGGMIAVIGGKGGVGKTNIATNLAIAAAGLRARVLLIDGDLGLANIDVLLGLTPRCTAAEILDGNCDFNDALIKGPNGIDLIPASSARMDLASSRPEQLTRLLAPLLAAGPGYDLVFVDVGSGISATVLSLASVCDRALLVTTPEPMSVADAYGTLKVMSRTAPSLPVELLVNAVENELQAHATHRQLELVGERFLGQKISMFGYLRRDISLERAAFSQRAVVEAYPSAVVSQQIVGLAARLVNDVRHDNPVSFQKRLWKRVPT